MNKITQDMKYRQSLINYTLKHGVSKASRKYNKARSYIYFWLNRYDGTPESLACQSRRPHGHPKAHTEAELKLIRDVRRRNPNLGILEFWYRLTLNGYQRPTGSLYRVMKRLGYFQAGQPKKKNVSKPMEQMQHPGQRVQIDVKYVPLLCITTKGERYYQFTAIDEYSRLRYLEAFEEKSTYSAAVFLKNAAAFFKKHGFDIECVQTDNGFEFTNRFSQSKRNTQTLFEATAANLGIRHKLIRPYTPRHNGKVERSHREDQKRFYSSHSFFSFQDYVTQLKAYLYRSNSIPMRPLGYLSPIEYLKR
ncbi:MAG: transposase family protein [Clostridiales bacterium]|nr:transposase family protein [Clostridiales bacterium]